MERSEIAEFLLTTPLAELGPEMDLLAERCYRERVAHNGRVPREIFESCIGIGGNYPCAQIIVEVVSDRLTHIGYALRRRDSSETGDEWVGLYHNVCTAIRLGETAEAVLRRDLGDILGEITGDDVMKGLEYIGTSLQSEPERRADAVTTIWKIKVHHAVVPSLIGTWATFTDNNDRRIIDHMQEILKWASDPNRPRFHRTFTKVRQ